MLLLYWGWFWGWFWSLFWDWFWGLFLSFVIIIRIGFGIVEVWVWLFDFRVGFGL